MENLYGLVGIDVDGIMHNKRVKREHSKQYSTNYCFMKPNYKTYAAENIILYH